MNVIRLKLPDTKPKSLAPGMLVLAGENSYTCEPGIINQHVDTLTQKVLITMFSDGITYPLSTMPFIEQLPPGTVVTFSICQPEEQEDEPNTTI